MARDVWWTLAVRRRSVIRVDVLASTSVVEQSAAATESLIGLTVSWNELHVGVELSSTQLTLAVVSPVSRTPRMDEHAFTTCPWLSPKCRRQKFIWEFVPSLSPLSLIPYPLSFPCKVPLSQGCVERCTVSSPQRDPRLQGSGSNIFLVNLEPRERVWWCKMQMLFYFCWTKSGKWNSTDIISAAWKIIIEVFTEFNWPISITRIVITVVGWYDVECSVITFTNIFLFAIATFCFTVCHTRTEHEFNSTAA